MQAYAPKKPLYSGAMDTQHTLDVVVGALVLHARTRPSRWLCLRLWTHHCFTLLYKLWLYLQGALLALTDGKLADMQAAAEVDGGVQQLNAAIESAQALGGRRGET